MPVYIREKTNLSSCGKLNQSCPDFTHLNMTIHWKLVKLSSIAGLIPQGLQLQAQVRIASARSLVRVYRRISAIRAAKVLIFFCLRM